MASEGGEDDHQEEQRGVTHGDAAEVDPPGGAAGAGVKTCNVDVGRFRPALFPLCLISVPSELAGSPIVNRPVDLDHRSRVPGGCWRRCLDLKTGTVFFRDLLSDLQEEGKGDEMSRGGKAPKLDLRLNLSIHQAAGGTSASWEGGGGIISPGSSSSSASSPSSCLSSETDRQLGGRRRSPREAASMVLVGCPRCLMYVMLSGDDPRCPKCKGTMLLDFLRDPNIAVNPPKKTRKLN